MAAPTPIALTFSPQARAKIDAFLARITGYPPTLCIMKGRTLPETDDKWTYGAYGPDNLKALAPDLDRLGKPLLYAVDGLSVAIPQYHLVHELEGKVLELGEGCLIVRDANAAI